MSEVQRRPTAITSVTPTTSTQLLRAREAVSSVAGMYSPLTPFRQALAFRALRESGYFGLTGIDETQLVESVLPRARDRIVLRILQSESLGDKIRVCGTVMLERFKRD